MKEEGAENTSTITIEIEELEKKIAASDPEVVVEP